LYHEEFREGLQTSPYSIRPENTEQLLPDFATAIVAKHRFFTVVLGKRGQSLAMLTSTDITELALLESHVFSGVMRERLLHGFRTDRQVTDVLLVTLITTTFFDLSNPSPTS
jgi:hypothetical protein